MTDDPYQPFLQSRSQTAWKKIGLRRRAGVCVPLFSVLSKESSGVGEFEDLEILGKWCRLTGMSLIQTLPVNDMGTRFCPYDAESSFALDPMHIRLTNLEGVDEGAAVQEARRIRKMFPLNSVWYDTSVKAEKIEALRKLFVLWKPKKSPAYLKFCQANEYWLKDYACYRILKSRFQQAAWEVWPSEFRDRLPEAMKTLAANQAEEIEFHQWTQWQLHKQFQRTAKNLRRKKVYILGDLPFLVSRDSADVWAHPDFFKLHLSAGAPPDRYFEDGQEWGMPPYDWDRIRQTDYEYFKEKLKYAAEFYDLFRIDHFVGLLRVWVFPREGEGRKKKAFFDPPEEHLWPMQVREILNMMMHAASMLPCAEDLGTVPDVAREILKEYAIPGMEIQRWARDWHGTKDFLRPESYRPNSVVTLSTHDMGSFEWWWRFEATREDKKELIQFTGAAKEDCRLALQKALEKASEAASVFSIQFFLDWLGLASVFKVMKKEYRVNYPGVVHEKNWRLRAPLYLEDWAKLSCNSLIRKINRNFGRD